MSRHDANSLGPHAVNAALQGHNINKMGSAFIGYAFALNNIIFSLNVAGRLGKAAEDSTIP